MTLGEKIRTCRKAKKMTQEALAGETITRNMLSKLERDRATPSLETIKYIAKRLELPLAYFFSDDEDLFFYEKQEQISEIYRDYSQNHYRSCIYKIKKLSGTDDELEYLLTSAYFEEGKTDLFRGALISAQKNFALAIEASKKTVYKTGHITALIPMYVSVATNIQAPLLEFNAESYTDGLIDVYDFEFYKYLTQDFDYNFKNTVFSYHAKAKKLIKERQYQEAIELLQNATEVNSEGYNAFAIFGIYTDLELCYKQLLDFEKAYKYIAKRLSMIEGFKS